VQRKRPNMQSYQIYGLDEQGRILQPPAVIFCDTDGEAINYAGALAGGQAVEIRDGARMVMRIEAINPVASLD
jgi:hypothetical protein